MPLPEGLSPPKKVVSSSYESNSSNLSTKDEKHRHPKRIVPPSYRSPKKVKTTHDDVLDYIKENGYISSSSGGSSNRLAVRDEQGTPTLKSVTCNCKRTHCLKLYCDCFRFKKYCSGCNCRDCANVPEMEATRHQAMIGIIERNPEAFKPKILKSTEKVGEKEHLAGCHCKRSACLKKYCECYTAHVSCSEKCRCKDCKNQPSDSNVKYTFVPSSITMAYRNDEDEDDSQGEDDDEQSIPGYSGVKVNHEQEGVEGVMDDRYVSPVRILDWLKDNSTHIGKTDMGNKLEPTNR